MGLSLLSAICLSPHLHCAKLVSKRLLAHLTSLIDIPSKQAPQKYLNEKWSARASSPFRILLETDTKKKYHSPEIAILERRPVLPIMVRNNIE